MTRTDSQVLISANIEIAPVELQSRKNTENMRIGQCGVRLGEIGLLGSMQKSGLGLGSSGVVGVVGIVVMSPLFELGRGQTDHVIELNNALRAVELYSERYTKLREYGKKQRSVQ
ncbi:hypothetical protein CVT26_000472 [Gymnopilus dilepis]|uniref:Uncharacterized protein n=1 Tax=Gymnopilus dilepis TaxID=231916 RepID=A0A409Y2D2_9AGAR|nr:hypothetical protein CVT26_000472 [Gymnopilus dilepis]